MNTYDTQAAAGDAAMTRLFHDHIELGNWYDAAVIVLQYSETREDPQDWLSGGDVRYMLSKPIREIAAEWDAAQQAQ